MAITPRDLSVTWTHDAMVCETRPHVRSTSVPGIKWVGPTAAVLFFVVAPLLGVLLVALWLCYVVVHWYRENQRVEQIQHIRLTSDAVVVTRTLGEKEVFKERLPLRSIGLVSAKQRLGAFELIMRRAGANDFAIPINSESQTAGEWLAAAIQSAAKAARSRDGDGIAEIPGSLRELIERGSD